MTHKAEQNNPPGDRESLKGGHAQVKIPIVTLRYTIADHRYKHHNERHHTKHAEPGDALKLVQEHRREEKTTCDDGPHGVWERVMFEQVVEKVSN